MVRLTNRPDTTLDVYRGRKTTIQQQQLNSSDVYGNADNTGLLAKFTRTPPGFSHFTRDPL